MTDLTIPDEARQAATRHPMAKHLTWRQIDGVLENAGPLIVAYELRQMAASLEEARAEWDFRSLRSAALGHAIDKLLTRANELDSAGAQ